MIKKNLLKGICLLWLLLAVTPVLQAQDRAQQASELLDRLIAGQGDSVYVHLDDNIRKMLSVEMLNGLFKQLEQQAGKYQSHGLRASVFPGRTALSGSSVPSAYHSVLSHSVQSGRKGEYHSFRTCSG